MHVAIRDLHDASKALRYRNQLQEVHGQWHRRQALHSCCIQCVFSSTHNGWKHPENHVILLQNIILVGCKYPTDTLNVVNNLTAVATSDFVYNIT